MITISVRELPLSLQKLQQNTHSTTTARHINACASFLWLHFPLMSVYHLKVFKSVTIMEFNRTDDIDNDCLKLNTSVTDEADDDVS